MLARKLWLQRIALPTDSMAVRLHYGALTVICAVGAWLRLTALNRQSLWFDEIDVVVRAQQPLTIVFRTFVREGENGPLYNLLLALWVRLAGVSEIAVRFPSAVVGVLTIPLLYVLARSMGGSSAGLYAAGLLAISPYHIWYSQEAKMYALLIFLAVASTLALSQALAQNTRYWWVAYVVVTSLMFYTHVVSVLVFAAHALYGLLSFTRWPGRLRPWSIAALALTLPYLPIALWAMRVVGGEVTTWQPDVSLWQALRISAVKFAVNRADSQLETRAALLYTVLACLGILAFARRRSGSRTWLLLLLWSSVPVVGLWLVSLRQSVFSDRYASTALPALLILVAAALVLLVRSHRLWPAGAVALFLVVSFAWVPVRDVNRASSAEKEDWRSAWADVAARAEKGDGFIVHPGYLITTRDYFVQREPRLAQFRAATIPTFRVGWLDEDLMVHKLATQLQGLQRVWLIQSPDRVPAEDPHGMLEAWLRSTGPPLYEHEFNGVRVSLYRLPPLPP